MKKMLYKVLAHFELKKPVAMPQASGKEELLRFYFQFFGVLAKSPEEAEELVTSSVKEAVPIKVQVLVWPQTDYETETKNSIPPNEVPAIIYKSGRAFFQPSFWFIVNTWFRMFRLRKSLKFTTKS